MNDRGVITVRKTDRIIGRRGTKQIGAITSAERGTLITVVGTISASGNSIPSAVGSVVEWSKHRTDDQHGLGLKPTFAILLCPWERHITTFSPA